MVRAEPISALYEQGRVHHVGSFPELEDQMSTYAGGSGSSPDRLDALVYALSDLMNTGGGRLFRLEAIQRAFCDSAPLFPEGFHG